MPAECYICAEESKPRYCCLICGGLFCEQHGKRNDKRSICSKCLVDDIKTNIVKAKQLITYLTETKDFLQHQVAKVEKAEEKTELQSLINEIESILKQTRT